MKGISLIKHTSFDKNHPITPNKTGDKTTNTFSILPNQTSLSPSTYLPLKPFLLIYEFQQTLIVFITIIVSSYFTRYFNIRFTNLQSKQFC